MHEIDYTEFIDIELPGKDAFDLTMAAKTLVLWHRRNPSLVKTRDTEKIQFALHILNQFSRFYQQALFEKESVPLPEELMVLAYSSPSAACYTICTMQPLDSCAELPAGGMGYVWGFMTETGEACGDPIVCSKDGIPSGPDLKDPKMAERREQSWLFALPERIIEH